MTGLELDELRAGNLRLNAPRDGRRGDIVFGADHDERGRRDPGESI